MKKIICLKFARLVAKPKGAIDQKYILAEIITLMSSKLFKSLSAINTSIKVFQECIYLAIISIPSYLYLLQLCGLKLYEVCNHIL
jgi:hypothetical protein